MKMPFVVTLSILLFQYSFCQVTGPIAMEEFTYRRVRNPFDEIPLFNREEIKSRKIDTAYLVYHPASWAEDDTPFKTCPCSYNDTLESFVFDNEGRIQSSTTYQLLGDYSSTKHFDTLGKFIGITSYRKNGTRKGSSTIMFNDDRDSTQYKEIIKKQINGSDTIETKIIFWKFKKGLDTAFIETYRYNKKGKLIEEQSSVNKKNAYEIDDDTGESTYHYKYDYDDAGRLTYYQDLADHEYQKITYPVYGKQTNYYQSGTNRLLHTELKLIKELNGLITISSGGSFIILTPLEKGSKLFKLKTVVGAGEIPLLFYIEFIYKSNNK